LTHVHDRNAVLERLRLPAKVSEEVLALLAHPLPEGAGRWTDGDVRRWASGLGRERVQEALALARANGLAEAVELQMRVEQLLSPGTPLSVRDLALNGQDVMQVLGVGPSPVVGEATRWLLSEVLEAPERNTEAALRKALSAWAQAKGLKPGGLG